jgi:hypothetical protein
MILACGLRFVRLGAAAAAEKSGDSKKARRHYTAAVALTQNADPV